MSIILEVTDGKGHTRWFESSDEFLMGRDPARVKLVVEDDLVSRVHGGFVRRINGDWIYIHRGRNKSRVDGRRMTRLSDQVMLRNGSIIQIGTTYIAVRFDDDAPTTVMGTAGIATQDPEDESPELFELDDPQASEDGSDDSIEGRTILDTDWRAEVRREGGEPTTDASEAAARVRREVFPLHTAAGNSEAAAVSSGKESAGQALVVVSREVEEVDVSPPTLPPESRVGGFWTQLLQRMRAWFFRR